MVCAARQERQQGQVTLHPLTVAVRGSRKRDKCGVEEKGLGAGVNHSGLYNVLYFVFYLSFPCESSFISYSN